MKKGIIDHFLFETNITSKKMYTDLGVAQLTLQFWREGGAIPRLDRAVKLYDYMKFQNPGFMEKVGNCETFFRQFLEEHQRFNAQ